MSCLWQIHFLPDSLDKVPRCSQFVQISLLACFAEREREREREGLAELNGGRMRVLQRGAKCVSPCLFFAATATLAVVVLPTAADQVWCECVSLGSTTVLQLILSLQFFSYAMR